MAFKKLYPLQFPIKRNQYEAIGHITVQWAFLETEIDMAILHILARLQSRGRTITDEEVFMRRTFNKRVAQLRKLGDEFYSKPPQIKKLNRLLDKAMNLKQDRDFLVHGRWRAEVEGGNIKNDQISAEKYHFDALKTLRERDYHSQRMRKIAQDLSSLNRDFLVFINITVRGVVPPSPGTYFLLKK